MKKKKGEILNSHPFFHPKHGWGGPAGGARARKNRAGGSMGALCIGFTLVKPYLLKKHSNSTKSGHPFFKNVLILILLNFF